MDWAKTTARQEDNHLIFVVWAYVRNFTVADGDRWLAVPNIIGHLCGACFDPQSHSNQSHNQQPAQ